MRLEEREALEKLEFAELSKSSASSALFTATESEVFPAQRSREQFERFFVPAFTLLLFFLQAGGAFFLWRWLQRTLPAPIVDPQAPLGLFFMFALALFLLGRFSTSLARLQKLPLLRPGASYLLLNADIGALVGLAIVGMLVNIPLSDMYLARALAILLGLVSIETLVNLILEFYRPRVKGKIARPVYESRLVSLLGQPEGLFTTAAQTLDYQFGFKVSETWAYQLFEKWLPWLLVAQLVVLLLSSCFVVIDAGQEAVLEHFGKPARETLKPGLNFKWPWPADRAYRYATEKIQTINVGFVPEDTPMRGNVVLWTVPHTKEENFLVANRELPAPGGATNAPAENRPPPVSLLTVSIPVQFQITNLTAWVYNNADPLNLLTSISTSEVVHYFVSVDLQEIMSTTRWSAAQVLRDRIQAEADRHHMGANIVFVGVQDIHPPVKVAPDYEKVISAIHDKATSNLDASTYAIIATNNATAQAFKTVAAAQAESARVKVNALAQAALFTNQLPAYLASPSVYKQRAYLETFSRSVANSRMYVLLATNTQDVIILDLEDKIRADILDQLPLSAPKAR